MKTLLISLFLISPFLFISCSSPESDKSKKPLVEDQLESPDNTQEGKSELEGVESHEEAPGEEKTQQDAKKEDQNFHVIPVPEVGKGEGDSEEIREEDLMPEESEEDDYFVEESIDYPETTSKTNVFDVLMAQDSEDTKKVKKSLREEKERIKKLKEEELGLHFYDFSLIDFFQVSFFNKGTYYAHYRAYVHFLSLYNNEDFEFTNRAYIEAKYRQEANKLVDSDLDKATDEIRHYFENSNQITTGSNFIDITKFQESYKKAQEEGREDELSSVFISLYEISLLKKDKDLFEGYFSERDRSNLETQEALLWTFHLGVLDALEHAGHDIFLAYRDEPGRAQEEFNQFILSFVEEDQREAHFGHSYKEFLVEDSGIVDMVEEGQSVVEILHKINELKVSYHYKLKKEHDLQTQMVLKYPFPDIYGLADEVQVETLEEKEQEAETSESKESDTPASEEQRSEDSRNIETTHSI